MASGKVAVIVVRLILLLCACCGGGVVVVRGSSRANFPSVQMPPTRTVAVSTPTIVKPTFQFGGGSGGGAGGKTRSLSVVPPRNHSSSIWSTPSPQLAASNAETHRQGSSKPYKTFYRVFYGQNDASAARLTTRAPSKGRRLVYENTQDLESIYKANSHMLRVQQQARCSVPKPRVVRVREVYTDTSKDYFPRCTVLHRCNDDTSCCGSPDLHCAPKMIQEVQLYFYTLHTIRTGQNNGVQDTVQPLLFENHTACECVPVNDMPRSLASAASATGGAAGAGASGEENAIQASSIGTTTGTSSSSPGQDLSWSSAPSKKPESLSWRTELSVAEEDESEISPVPDATTTTSPSIATTSTSPPPTTSTSPPEPSALREYPRRLCHHVPTKCPQCPIPFTMRLYPDGRCSCDCFDKEKPCLKIKRGRDVLHYIERRCVEQSRCHIPECEYGNYSYETGRCPKRPDNYRKFPDGRENPNHHHRSNFFERD